MHVVEYIRAVYWDSCAGLSNLFLGVETCKQDRKMDRANYSYHIRHAYFGSYFTVSGLNSNRAYLYARTYSIYEVQVMEKSMNLAPHRIFKTFMVYYP